MTLFITTASVDCYSHVRAWVSAFGPVDHITFDPGGLKNDWMYIQAAQELKPDLIFYIGAQTGSGKPRRDSFKQLRDVAPLVNLCSDAQDHPWHRTLKAYREYFDLQVSLDGARSAPVDLAVLTPVDPGPFQVEVPRDIRCGFSGSVGRWNSRSEIINALDWFGGITVRRRTEIPSSYTDHVNFMKSCRMLLNISATGTGHANHIKGRVLEAGWAGCALLEDAASPIGEWFPEDCYFSYRDIRHAAEIIAEADDAEIECKAARLSEEVRNRFTAKQIYEEIISHVHRSVPVTPA